MKARIGVDEENILIEWLTYNLYFAHTRHNKRFTDWQVQQDVFFFPPRTPLAPDWHNILFVLTFWKPEPG